MSSSMGNANRVGAGELRYVSYPDNGVALDTRFTSVKYNEQSRQHLLLETAAAESQGIPAGFMLARLAFKVEGFRLRTACLINSNTSQASPSNSTKYSAASSSPSSTNRNSDDSSSSSSSVDSVTSNFGVPVCVDPFFDPEVKRRKDAKAASEQKSQVPTSASSSSVNSVCVLPQQQLYNEIHAVNDFIVRVKVVLEAFGEVKHDAMGLFQRLNAAVIVDNRESTTRLSRDCEELTEKLMVCTGELIQTYRSTIRTRS